MPVLILTFGVLMPDSLETCRSRDSSAASTSSEDCRFLRRIISSQMVVVSWMSCSAKNDRLSLRLYGARRLVFIILYFIRFVSTLMWVSLQSCAKWPILRQACLLPARVALHDDLFRDFLVQDLVPLLVEDFSLFRPAQRSLRGDLEVLDEVAPVDHVQLAELQGLRRALALRAGDEAVVAEVVSFLLDRGLL